MTLPWIRSLQTLCLLLSAASASADALDIAYGDGAKQKLDVYAAAGLESVGAPVVMWVHGGGWRNGDKGNTSGITLCKAWAAAGVVMVNLNYRLAPDAVHPAQVQDVAAGIAWVHKNIAAHGGNPKRVYLLGHSAGAHLVALVATAPQYLEAHGLAPSTALAGVMPVDTASYDLVATEQRLVRKMIRDAFGEDPATLAGASPLLQAQRNPGACPPFIIVGVTQRPEALREAVALDKALTGSRLIVVDYPSQGQLKAHGQVALDLMDLESSVTQELLAFVRAAR